MPPSYGWRPQGFSFTTEGKGKGHDGERGGLFLHTIDVMLEVRQLTAPRRFGFMYENVAMANVGAEGVTLAPIRKLARTIGDALQDNALMPAAASRLAGKLAFLTQATFGAVGKAALQPLYSRSHSTSPHTTDELTNALRAALNAIHAMLRDIQPRFLPFQVQETVRAVIFADAYVKTGEQEYKAGHIPAGTPLPRHARWYESTTPCTTPTVGRPERYSTS